MAELPQELVDRIARKENMEDREMIMSPLRKLGQRIKDNVMGTEEQNAAAEAREIERARGFARCGANTTRKLREIVCRMQIARGFFPISIVNQIIPIRDLVIHRAAIVAVRNAAIHATCGLILCRFFRQRDHKFLVVTNAIRGRRITTVATIDFEKSGYLTHRITPPQQPQAALFVT